MNSTPSTNRSQSNKKDGKSGGSQRMSEREMIALHATPTRLPSSSGNSESAIYPSGYRKVDNYLADIHQPLTLGGSESSSSSINTSWSSFGGRDRLGSNSGHHGGEVLRSPEFVRPIGGLSILELMTGTARLPRTSSKFIIPEETADDSQLRWEYPGWGTVIESTVDAEDLPQPTHKHQLDVYRSTAIAGNDLLASVLYTTGIVCTACGQLAPFSMFICCLCLFPFRKIFQECGTALPLNGGVYVALLNSASKFIATFAASCSLLSYSATAVVSAASCTTYAKAEFGDFDTIPVTIGVLAFFAVLVLFGVKDSANVALGIFSIHLLTLIVLIFAGFISIIRNDGEIWKNNWASPLPISKSGGIPMDLYLGEGEIDCDRIHFISSHLFTHLFSSHLISSQQCKSNM